MSLKRKFFIGWCVIMGLFLIQEVARAQYIRMLPPGRTYWGVHRNWPGYNAPRVNYWRMRPNWYGGWR